ncbi:MAG: DUF3900 domain-containing protein [Candidatus Riflebacteria bacterium]|nr:DUF3900 domain-containing protein [Candidatus Riflebacteria bacterium]
MSKFDWQLEYLSVHVVRLREKSDRKDPQALARLEGLGEEDTVLENLLDGLLLAAFKKKPDITPTAACRAYRFLASGSGEADRRLLQSALAAPRLEEFEEVASDLAARYADLPEAHPALLLFTRSRVTTPADTVLPFFVMFACDFDEVSVLTGESPGILEKLGEAVTHRLRKALIYPFVDAGLQDEGRATLIQVAASEGFSELLSLEEPQTTPELFSTELRTALDQRAPQPAYDRYFREPPPAVRPLFGEERYVRLEHLLPVDEVKHVADLTFHSSKEKFDKEMKLRIAIDDFGKFEARMDRLNRDFFFARRGDDKYLIVRANKFLTRDQLNPVEFMAVEELDQVIKKID